MKTAQIIEALEMLSPYSQEELMGYITLINAEKEAVENRLAELGEQPCVQSVMLAAARANYKIALVNQSADKVTHFKAGDISITEGSEALENAKRLLDEVSSACPQLCGGEGFAFECV